MEIQLLALAAMFFIVIGDTSGTLLQKSLSLFGALLGIIGWIWYGLK